MIIYPLLGIVLGVIIGSYLPISLPLGYAKFLSVALLAGFDSVFGGIRAGLEGNYNNKVFLTGFFITWCIAPHTSKKNIYLCISFESLP